MSKEIKKNKFSLPKGRTAVILAVLLVLVLIASVFIYRATSDLIAKATIFNPGGAPVLNSPTADPNTNSQPGEPTPTTAISLDTFTMPTAWDGKSRVNLLVMGLDSRSPDAANPLTDTMILFTLDPVANTAGMISIPRDLWVKIPGGEYNKINTAYSVGEMYQLPGGGPGLASRTVENLLGVPIDYYAQIDFGTFIEIIDLIDGVKITNTDSIQLNIVDTTFSQWLEPGTYTLTGELALAYVRYREPEGGDIARSQRQQQVILAVRDRILDFNMLPTLIQRAPQLYESLSKGINSNLSLQQIIQLGIKVLNDIPRDQITHTAIGWQQVTSGTSPDGLSILRPIPSKIRELRDEVFSGTTLFDPENAANLQEILQQEAATVAVHNASSQTGLAERASTWLQSQGIHVIEVGNAAYSATSTITFYGAKPYTLRYLKEFAGITQDYHVFYAYDPAISPQIVLVLGDDFAANNNLP